MENKQIKSVNIQIGFEDTTITHLLNGTVNDIKIIETTDETGKKHTSYVFDK